MFCSSAQASTPPLLRDPVEIALDQIGETGHRLGKTYEMIHFGEGMEKKFLRLQLSFRVKRKMSKNEARELLLVCAREFIEDINANEQLRPYLLEYPFTLNNVGIEFYFQEEDGTPFFHPYLSHASCNHLGLEFATRDLLKKYGYKQFDEETHEEALALVRGQRR